ncbi:Uncharacterised protein [uncultured archaeon]|nr:Uncharacterised protein [uncultured archaeon]
MHWDYDRVKSGAGQNASGDKTQANGGGGMMSSNGQATVEFLLTIVVSLLIITTVVLPNYDAASKGAQDATNISKLRVSAEKISNAVQYVAIAGNGTKQTIEAVVTTGSTISFDAPAAGPIACQADYTAMESVKFTYAIKSSQKPSACASDDDLDPGTCTKKFNPGQQFCGPTTMPVLAPGIYSVAISKSGNVVAVTPSKVG